MILSSTHVDEMWVWRKFPLLSVRCTGFENDCSGVDGDGNINGDGNCKGGDKGGDNPVLVHIVIMRKETQDTYRNCFEYSLDAVMPYDCITVTS